MVRSHRLVTIWLLIALLLSACQPIVVRRQQVTLLAHQWHSVCKPPTAPVTLPA